MVEGQLQKVKSHTFDGNNVMLIEDCKFPESSTILLKLIEIVQVSEL